MLYCETEIQFFLNSNKIQKSKNAIEISIEYQNMGVELPHRAGGMSG